MQTQKHYALTGNLMEDTAYFKKRFHHPQNVDIIFRYIDCTAFSACILFMDGMINAQLLEDFVLRAVQNEENDMPPECRIDCLLKRSIQIAGADRSSDIEKLVESIVSGGAVLLCQDAKEAAILDVRGYEMRKITVANNESVVNGSQEGFVENLRTNITLVRRYCQNADVVTEMYSLGSATQSRAAVVYIDGTVDAKALAELKSRISAITAPVINSVGQLQQLIEDSPMSLVPQMLMTERPDRTMAALTDGQFAVFLDNSPYALIAPCDIFVLMQSSDDAFSRWQYGTYMRLIRFAGLLLALLLPGIYVALISYHTQLIPLSLLSAIAETRVNVPFSVLSEVIIMELAFFLVNEANLRIPSQVGMSISIIGGLVLGQAAVQASIISPLLIIIIALSGLGCYCMPDYGMTFTLIICRLFIVICGAALGLYGVAIALFVMLCHVCSLRSFGHAFFAPLAPSIPHNRDLLIRFPSSKQKLHDFFAKTGTWKYARKENAD